MNNIIKFAAILVLIGAIFFLATHKSTAPAATGPKPLVTVVYSCNNGKGIMAAFYEASSTPATSSTTPPTPGGSVALNLTDGRSLTLKQTLSADGGRYANADESFVFWGKGNGALVLENNKEQSYTGCILIAPDQAGQSLPITYSNSANGFSIRLPQGYTVDEKYKYQQLGPGKDITGVKFAIAPTVASGTNLSADTYLSVEEIPQAKTCGANLFLSGVKAVPAQDGPLTYSVATSTGAGAGNRYQEAVFALPGTNPCIAVRYYIHYGAIENYPLGSVQQFDAVKLLAEFDGIRHSLVIVQ